MMDWMRRAGACLAAAALGAGAEAPDFARDVRPVLEARCYECHGPAARRGGLRLSNAADARQGGDSGEALVAPGDPEASPLLRRILSDDPAERMPPGGEPLPPDEVAVLRAWIAAGADWGDAPAGPARATSDHWAFQAPVAAAPPGGGHPVDAFVRAGLAARGLSPSPEADARTLARRLSLDLRGLPPSPEEVAEFLADEQPDAYLRLVDRFLASPQFGERMAVGWLDAARHADTNGYEKDRHRSIWPYRDWVISAINHDLPYDRFVVEQVAGDLLPNATEAQRVATGFLRNSPFNEEGGVDLEEYRYHAVVDRLNTTATAVLGLTMGCAQCHTHKYDPFTQREYFQLLAFLNNTDDLELPLDAPDTARRRAEIQAEIDARTADLPNRFPLPEGDDGAGDAAARRAAHLAARQAAWEAEHAASARGWIVAQPVAHTSKNRATFNKLPDGSLLMSGDNPNTDTYTVDYFVPVGGITAIRLEALPDPSLPGGGPGRGVIMSEGDFFLSEIAAAAAPWSRPGDAAPVALRNATESHAGNGRAAALALDGRLDTGWSIIGAPGRPHAAVFEAAEAFGDGDGTLLRLTLDQVYVHQHTLGRFRVSVDTAPPPARATGLPAAVEAALRVPAGARDAEARALIAARFLQEAPELAGARAEIDALRATMPKPPTTLVVAERADPRETRLHHRGEFLHPRDPVPAETPDVLPPLPPEAPRNRLAFARWLVSRENPLAARVAMNRLWQTLFGEGLVDTPEDFGVMGTRPTHPELLDWLAVEFMRRDWSLKAMTRLLVSSDTYRQTSRATPELLEADPANRWLARAPRFRVEAESVRDIALAASGLLNPEMGGPSVMLPLPPGLIDTVYTEGQVWFEVEGPARHRRAVYTYMKRILPYPGLAGFDAPARDAACVRRARSNTPLQALSLLNDPFFFEAAEAMARRVALEAAGDAAARIRHAFLLCLARPPDDREEAWLADFLEAQTAAHGEDRAWTLLCRVLLNLDETITRT